MRRRPVDQTSFAVGIISSAAAHFLCALLALFMLQRSASLSNRPQEIFSVTLEGGERLGGITQIPKDNPKYLKPPSELADSVDDASPPPKSKKGSETAKDSSKDNQKDTSERAEGSHKLVAPAVVDDPEKILAEKKAAEEKKRKEEAKRKKEQEEKKKAEDDKKKKVAEDEKKRKEEEGKKQTAVNESKRKEDEKRAFSRRLSQITGRLKAQYDGESVDAGGTGFGAARLGGHGMGGGILAPAEKIAYSAQLQQYVKQGWHWMPGGGRLRAYVLVKIDPNGDISSIRVEESSGNSHFDDSVVRAVEKASPVPKPPDQYYQDFSAVGFWFDSQEQ